MIITVLGCRDSAQIDGVPNKNKDFRENPGRGI